MDLGGIWAAVNFPSMITGFCGRVYSTAQRSGARLCNDPRVQRLDGRGVVAAAPRPVDPARHHLPRRSREGRGRDPSQRGSRCRGGDVPRAPAQDRLPVDLRRLVGPGDARVRRHRHRHLPARRLVGSRRRRSRRTVGHDGDTVRSAGAHVVRGVGVVRLAPAVSRPEDRDVGGRARLGRDAARPARLHGRSRRVPVQRVRPRSAARRRRAAQFLVLHPRRPVDHRHPPPHRRGAHHARGRLSRTATPPGPTPNASSRSTGDTCRTTSSGS